jgi:hypothetical protein
MSILRYFITSKAKRKVLRLFLEDVETPYYTREVARLVDEPLNAVRRELGHLEKAGFLSSYMQGNQKYHRVTSGFPLLQEWRKIILETPDAITRPDVTPPPPVVKSPDVVARSEATKQSNEPEQEPVTLPLPVIASAAKQSPAPFTVPTLTDHLRTVFQDIPGITLAIIHGQSALQDSIPREGVDLMVVGDIPNDSLMQIISGIEDETGVRFNLVRMTRSDFDYRNARGDSLIRKMWSEKKLVVKGRH